MNFNAYYYSFDPTGNADVDAILEAVADAGKGAHHTHDWQEYEFDKAIQEAANKAASNIAALAQKEAAAPGDAMAALTTEGMIELFDTIARKHGITEMSANNGRSDSMIPLVLAELFHAIAQSSAALAQPVAVDAPKVLTDEYILEIGFGLGIEAFTSRHFRYENSQPMTELERKNSEKQFAFARAIEKRIRRIAAIDAQDGEAT